MTEATFFCDWLCDLWADEMILIAWKSESEVVFTVWKVRFKIAEFDKSIFLSAAFTALWREWCKIADADFAGVTLIARELDVEEISAEIAAESLKNSWSVSESFISVRLDFLRGISFLFLLISMLIDITIESVFWLYS